MSAMGRRGPTCNGGGSGQVDKTVRKDRRSTAGQSAAGDERCDSRKPQPIKRLRVARVVRQVAKMTWFFTGNSRGVFACSTNHLRRSASCDYELKRRNERVNQNGESPRGVKPTLSKRVCSVVCLPIPRLEKSDEIEIRDRQCHLLVV